MINFIALNFNFLEGIFDALDQPIVLADVEGEGKYIIRKINYALLRDSGMKAENIINKSLKQAISKNTYELVVGKYNEAFRTKKVVEFSHQVKVPNGDYYYETTIFPVLEGDECKQLFIVTKNVTKFKLAEKDLKKKEEMFKLLAENTIDVIGKLNMRGEVTHASPSIEQLLGYRPEELIGKNNLDYLHEADREESRARFIDAFKKNREGNSTFRMIRKDKSIVWVENRYKVVVNENGEREIIAVLHDVSKRKEIQDQLSTYAYAAIAMLEDKFGEKLSIAQLQKKLDKYIK